jgi:hypothetical protein
MEDKYKTKLWEDSKPIQTFSTRTLNNGFDFNRKSNFALRHDNYFIPSWGEKKYIGLSFEKGYCITGSYRFKNFY